MLIILKVKRAVALFETRDIGCYIEKPCPWSGQHGKG